MITNGSTVLYVISFCPTLTKHMIIQPSHLNVAPSNVKDLKPNRINRLSISAYAPLSKLSTQSNPNKDMTRSVTKIQPSELFLLPFSLSVCVCVCVYVCVYISMCICINMYIYLCLTKLISFQERIQLETSRLYKQAGVNPLAGSYRCIALHFVIVFYEFIFPLL